MPPTSACPPTKGDEAERDPVYQGRWTPCRAAIAPMRIQRDARCRRRCRRPRHVPARCARIRRAHVYLVVVSPSEDGTEALSKLRELSNSLRTYGIVHAGSVIVTHGGSNSSADAHPPARPCGAARSRSPSTASSPRCAWAAPSALPSIASPSRLWLRLRSLRCSKDRS